MVAGASNSGFAAVAALAITSVSVFLAFGATNWAVIVILLDPSFLSLGRHELSLRRNQLRDRRFQCLICLPQLSPSAARLGLE